MMITLVIASSQAASHSGDLRSVILMFIGGVLALVALIVIAALLMRPRHSRMKEDSSENTPPDPWATAGQRLMADDDPNPAIGGRFADDPDQESKE